MTRCSIAGIAFVWFWCALFAVADEAQDAAIKRDRQQIEGTWRIIGLEVNGNKAHEEDARKLTVANAIDGAWSLRSEGKEIAKGTTVIDPSRKPKTIDITFVDDQGTRSLVRGIYELSENTRKLCFAAAGKERPAEFASPAGSEQILVMFERVRDK